MTGLRGSGCSEVVRCLFGFQRPDLGKVLIEGKDVEIRDPREAIQNGIGFVPEDRQKEGIIPGMTTSDNLTLCSLDQISRLGWIKHSKEQAMAERSISDLAIKVTSPSQLALQLSGETSKRSVWQNGYSWNPGFLF